MSSEEYLLNLFNKTQDEDYALSTQINQRSSPFVKYSKDRLTVKYVGKGLLYTDITSIQTNKPINKDTLIYYYEVKIVEKGQKGDIWIGLAESDFPPNKNPGMTKSSYGYSGEGKAYTAKAQLFSGLPKFNTGDTIGCGMNFFKREIFYTHNGEIVNAVFKDVELKEYYPTVGLHSLHETITLNFGSKNFKFDIKNLIVNQKREGIRFILQKEVSPFDVHKIVQSYLYFNGFFETLSSFEKATQITRGETCIARRIEPRSGRKIESNGTEKIEELEEESGINYVSNSNGRDNEEIPTTKQELEAMIIEEKRSSAREDGNIDYLERMRSGSFNIEQEMNFIKMERKESNMSDLFGDNSISRELAFEFGAMRKNSFGPVNSANLAHLATFDEQRKKIKALLLEGRVDEAVEVLQLSFPNILSENKMIKIMLLAQKFIELIKNKNISKAIEFAQENLNFSTYETFLVYKPEFPTGEENSIENLIGLICYHEPEKSCLKHLLTKEQLELLVDTVNKAILNFLGFSEKSILETLIGHLILIEKRFRESNNNYGQIFDFKV